MVLYRSKRGGDYASEPINHEGEGAWLAVSRGASGSLTTSTHVLNKQPFFLEQPARKCTGVFGASMRVQIDAERPVAGHDRDRVSPGGDVIREVLTTGGRAITLPLDPWTHDLRTNADMVAEHAKEQGWSFVGPVEVRFEGVDELSTGVFRVRSAVVAASESSVLNDRSPRCASRARGSKVRLVRKTRNRSRVGSIQSSVPVKPVWP